MELQSTRYEFSTVENEYLNHWESYISPPENANVIGILPPPNVTGHLHLGHLLDTMILDCKMRYEKCVLGKNVFIQPGTDHAGISTQYVVQKANDFQLTYEQFMEKVFPHVEECGNRIFQQIKNFQCLIDPKYKSFTMDAYHSDAVTDAFITLHGQNSIFRKKKIVNWDIKMKTVISDLEVVTKSVKGIMYYIKYQVKGKDETITIATTRPETIFSDVAIVCHPEDKRYIHLINSTILIPIINREIPFLSNTKVKIDKGTGLLKVTPHHSIADYEIAEDLQLDHGYSVISDTGQMENVPEEYIGMYVKKARQVIGNKLSTYREEIDQEVPYTQRSNVPLEYKITDQWFMNMKPYLTDIKEMNIYPLYHWQTVEHFIDNLQDWCISRQIWWGHPIPVYFKDDGNYIVAKSIEIAQQMAKEQGYTGKLVKSSDVLDTWFSSAIIPITLPKKYGIIYQPYDFLVTGYDILCFWVLKMYVMSKALNNSCPFKSVYLHPLIRDKNNEKMSKTKGNVVDPLEIIKRHGTDKTRMYFLKCMGSHHDIRMSEEELHKHQKFLTKLWNLGRYISGSVSTKNYDVSQVSNDICLGFIQQLQCMIYKIYPLMTTGSLNDYIKELIMFTRDILCNQFINIHRSVKSINKQYEEFDITILYGVHVVLKMLHPIIPTITEKLYIRIFGESILTHCIFEIPSVSIDENEFQKLNDLNKYIQMNFENKNVFINGKNEIASIINIQMNNKISDDGESIMWRDIELIIDEIHI